MDFHRRSNDMGIHERHRRKNSPESVDLSAKIGWRRFMNDRVTDRAYVPTAPGKEKLLLFAFLLKMKMT